MTTDYFSLPTVSADPMDIQMGEFDMEFGFSLNFFHTGYYSSQAVSNVSLYYDNIHWEDKDRKFINRLSHRMEFLALSPQDFDNEYEIDGSITISRVIQNDIPKIRCVFYYHREGDEDEILKKEIYLNPADAFSVAHNFKSSLEENKIVSLRQFT